MSLHLRSKDGQPISPDHLIQVSSVLETIVNRHDSLRVSIHQSCNDSNMELQLLQTLHCSSELKVCEIIHSSAQLPHSDECEVIHKEVCRPLDLTKQLFRFSMIHLSDKKIVIVMTVHHIVTDGVSIFLTVKELLQLLSGQLLEPNTVQFTDLLHANSATSSSFGQPMTITSDPKKQKKLEKWLTIFSSSTKCTSFPPLPRLEFSHSSSTTSPFASEHCYLDLPEDTMQALQSLSHTFNATPVVVLSTVFSLALHSLTQSDDIIIGMVNANRSGRTMNVLGYLVNTLPLRVDYTASYSSKLGELVKQVRRNWSMALDGDIDLNDLMLRLPCLQHNTEHSTFQDSPLQVFFSFYSVSGFEDLQTMVNIDGVEFTCRTDVPRPHQSHINLLLEFNPSRTNENGLPGFLWEFQTRVLNEQKVRYLHNVMCGCLLEAARLSETSRTSGAVVNPLSLVADVSRSLSNEMKDENISYSIASGTPITTCREQPDSLVYIQWFEKVAKEHPASPAFRLRNNNTHLTFSQVQNMVSHIALLLLERRVSPGDHVALYLNRNPLLYMCVLAVLKCAAAYVCLALQNSPERCVKLVELSQAKLVITETALLKKLPDMSCSVLCIDPDTTARLMECHPLTQNEEMRLAQLDRCYSPNLPFYLIFTSGTTGEPKVIVITNANIQASLHNILSLLSVQETRTSLTSCNVSFDGHILDSLGPLLNGGCLVVVDNITQLDGSDPYMEDVTSLFATPSAASLVTFPPSIRAMIVGGEAMSRACLENTKLIPHLLNVYGPSECTVIATCREVPRNTALEDLVTSEVANIGKPLPNVQLFVLDESLQPVPVNHPGILYISGPIVSDIGYYHDPQRTKLSFIQCSVNTPGSLQSNTVYMYNTGDWACMLPDGNFKFLGRKDDQVKLRGMRFQLLEVEKALSTCTEIKSAIALVNNPSTSSATLVGYVTPRDVNKTAVLDQVSSILPTYMVPSLLVSLDELPLTKDGKVDRRALMKIPLSQPSNLPVMKEANIVREDETTVMKLTNIFGRLLQVTDYPVDGNFFAYGGHSLLCFQLMKQVNQELGVRLNLTNILQQPTPQGIAGYLLHGQGCTHVLKEKPKENIVTHQPPPSARQTRSKHHHVMRGMVSFHLQKELEAIFNNSTTSDESVREKVSVLLAQETGYEIPGEKLCHYSSVEMLEVHLELRNTIMFRSTPQQVTATLYPPTSPTDTPTFFLHGGTIWWALAFSKLAHALKIYSVGVQCTQEASQQPTLEELCTFYLKHIQAIQPHGPYRLVGFCFGSSIVYELTRQLVELGEKIGLAVLINNSPMIDEEVRPFLFNNLGQPPPTSPSHPYNYFEEKLMLDFTEDGEMKALKREGVTVEEMTTAVYSKYHWLPFTPTELIQEYQQSFSLVQKGMLLYKPQPIKQDRAALVNNVLLFRNRQVLPLFKSHDYGLKKVVDPDSLSVIISPHDLLLDDKDSVTFMSSVIRTYIS